MPYIKTNWAEDTPITTALLNKIENGIEIATKEAETLPTPFEIGALPLIGGTMSGNYRKITKDGKSTKMTN